MWCWSRGISTDMSSLPRSAPLDTQPLDILAIAAHRDDVEQTCGGTLLKAAQRGQRTGILDLTQGEMGTRGTAEDRAREAADAAKILGVTWRHALDIPDGRVENTWENRLKVPHLPVAADERHVDPVHRRAADDADDGLERPLARHVGR